MAPRTIPQEGYSFHPALSTPVLQPKDSFSILSLQQLQWSAKPFMNHLNSLIQQNPTSQAHFFASIIKLCGLTERSTREQAGIGYSLSGEVSSCTAACAACSWPSPLLAFWLVFCIPNTLLSDLFMQCVWYLHSSHRIADIPPGERSLKLRLKSA